MAFGIDDPLEGVAVIAVGDGVCHFVHATVFVVGRDDRLADRVDELVVPLRPVACPTFGHGLGDHVQPLQVLGNGQGVRVLLPNLAIDPLHQAPAIGQVDFPVGSHAAYVEGHVHAQAIDVVFLHPHERIVTDVLPYFGAAEVRAGTAPRGIIAPVLVEVDAAAVVLAPAVESPQVQVAWPEVVVHHIQNYCKALAMGLLHEILELRRPAVGRLDSERMGRVVPPTAIPGELGNGHHLDAVDAQPLQVVELLDGVGKGAGCVHIRFGIVERADMQLVDDPLVPRWCRVEVVVPIEGAVVDDAVAHRVGDVPGMWINPAQFAGRRVEVEAVFLPGFCIRYVCGPVSVLFRVQRVGFRFPVVEITDDADRRGMRCPDAEGRAVGVRNGTHAGLRGGWSRGHV